MQYTDEELLDHYAIRDRTIARVRANFIASLDGAATHVGLTRGLNDANDKNVFDMLRMLCDVVLVGAGTLRNEGYADLRVGNAAALWRSDHGLPPQPTLAVVSGRLDLGPDMAPFMRAPTRPIIVTHERSSLSKRQELSRVADVMVCGTGSLDTQAMLAALTQRGLRQLLCEGGPHLSAPLSRPTASTSYASRSAPFSRMAAQAGSSLARRRRRAACGSNMRSPRGTC
jgi:riboflavin biosynthesis pyrimidine reductase